MRILRKHNAKLIRYTKKGKYDENGKWVKGSTIKSIPLKCCIQPVFNLTQQLDLPEGVREKDCRVIWTHENLIGASEATKNEADIIEYEGLTFEVYDVGYWNGAGRIKATEAVIVRKDIL